MNKLRKFIIIPIKMFLLKRELRALDKEFDELEECATKMCVSTTYRRKLGSEGVLALTKKLMSKNELNMIRRTKTHAKLGTMYKELLNEL